MSVPPALAPGLVATERAELGAWLDAPPRHPDRVHEPFECDAEVVRLAGGMHLAASVDAIEGEIASGLYRDPYTAGWLAAVNGLSDLAAVGAQPVGVLFAATWGPGWGVEERRATALGLGDSLRAAGVALLGGDSGAASATVLSVTAIGTLDGPPLRRVGAAAGDVLCITGKTGSGPALAVRHVLGEDHEAYPERWFRPHARLDEGQRLRAIASACTDASDGVLAAVDALARLNGLGADLEWNRRTVDDRGAAYLEARGLPLSMAWLSELSDYELVVAVPESRWPRARAAVPSLERIGRLTGSAEIAFRVGGARAPIDVGAIGRIARAHGDERRRLLAELLDDLRERGLP